VQINLAADAPLTFWALLSLGQSRKTSIAAIAGCPEGTVASRLRRARQKVREAAERMKLQEGGGR